MEQTVTARLARLEHLLGGGERFRFLVEPRRRGYLALLLCLHRRRQGHEVEVLHDELFADIQELVGPDGYDTLAFRQDVETLGRWGNVTERVEPSRIRSLSDRGRSKLLLRLDPETSALLAFLEARADPAPLGLRDQGANLLADIHRELQEAHRCLRAAGRDPAAPREQLLRALHLLHQADGATRRIAEDLVEISDRMARVAAEPFRVDEIAALGSWLELYVERYLLALESRGRAIRKAVGTLRAERFTAQWADAAQLERSALGQLPFTGELAGVRLRAPEEVLDALSAFFAVREGLEALCHRVNRRTREVIRRIQRHVEAVRLRNVRTEAIRARTAELFGLEGDGADRRAHDFLEALIAPVRVRSDGRGGIPTSRARPPRPARRQESKRPAFRSRCLEPKRSEPGVAKVLELRRLDVLSQFVESNILTGRREALVSQARIEDLLDARRLVAALGAYLLRSGRARPHLGFEVEPRPPGRARFDTGEFVLDASEALIRRRRP